MRIAGKDWREIFLGTGLGLGVTLGLAFIFTVFPPAPLQEYPYKLEKQKEYIAFHVDTTDFPMVVIDQMIAVFKDNEIKAEAIVFVKNRKPVSQIKLGPMVIKPPEKEEEKK